MKAPNVNKYILLLIPSILIIVSCNGTQEIKESSDSNKEVLSNSQVFGSGTTSNSNNETTDNGVHTVIVKEILPTEKYVYLNVSENGGEVYWIATLKQEVKIGDTYVYTGGLLKTNFKSLEHNRIFDKLYLVNRLMPANHSDNISMEEPISTEVETQTSEKIVVKGSVSISEIVSNPKKYSGKTVQVSGKCVKVNPNIMDKNWIHLKDGSKDDYDFVVTSDKAIPVGHKVTFKGTLTLNKDFGAGYKYDIILENGELLDK